MARTELSNNSDSPAVNDLWLDPESMPLGKDGIEDFYWPVSRADLESFRDLLQGDLMELVRHKELDTEVDWQVVRILSYEIITDALMVYQSVALHRRAEEAGVKIHASDKFRLHNALIKDQKPAPPRFSDWLWRGIHPPGTLLRWFRPLRDLKPLGAFKRKRLWLMNRSSDLVAIAAQPFTQRHAEVVYNETGKRVVLCSFWEWFSLDKSERKDLKNTQPIPDEIIVELLGLIEKAFERNGEKLSDLLRNYFAQWIGKASIPIHYYYERHLRRTEKLPLTLWYGSTNHLWTRVLRAAVQATGGSCTGHDHGRGVSMCPNPGEHGVVLDLCDTYVAYSPFLANEFSKLDKEILTNLPVKKVPHFLGRRDLFLPPPDSPINEVKGDVLAKTRVMYLASQLFGESQFLNCLPSDIATLDWQARLFSKLKHWKLDALFKEHPESKFDLPEEYIKQMGITKVSGYIEDCYDSADLFIFDFLSSPFRTVAFSDKALVFIDFGIGVLSSTTKEILSKRCSIVKGWYDSDNRAQVNWQELKDAIESAPKLKDKKSVSTLFGKEPNVG